MTLFVAELRASHSQSSQPCHSLTIIPAANEEQAAATLAIALREMNGTRGTSQPVYTVTRSPRELDPNEIQAWQERLAHCRRVRERDAE